MTPPVKTTEHEKMNHIDSINKKKINAEQQMPNSENYWKVPFDLDIEK